MFLFFCVWCTCCVCSYYRIWSFLKANTYRTSTWAPPARSGSQAALSAPATAAAESAPQKPKDAVVVELPTSSPALGPAPAPASPSNALPLLSADQSSSSPRATTAPAAGAPAPTFTFARSESVASGISEEERAARSEKRENDIASKMLVLPVGFSVCWTAYVIKVWWELITGQPCPDYWDAIATFGPTLNGERQRSNTDA